MFISTQCYEEPRKLLLLWNVVKREAWTGKKRSSLRGVHIWMGTTRWDKTEGLAGFQAVAAQWAAAGTDLGAARWRAHFLNFLIKLSLFQNRTYYWNSPITKKTKKQKIIKMSDYHGNQYVTGQRPCTAPSQKAFCCRHVREQTFNKQTCVWIRVH